MEERSFIPPSQDVGAAEPLCIRVLGRLGIEAGGHERALPASRKTRALLGYLLLAPRPVTRERLGDLFWESAGDPRGELRWSLAKLRPLLRTASAEDTLRADHDSVHIDASRLQVDALTLARSIEHVAHHGSAAEVEALLALAEGELLEGLSLAHCGRFHQWLQAERARHEAWRQQLLERRDALRSAVVDVSPAAVAAAAAAAAVAAPAAVADPATLSASAPLPAAGAARVASSASAFASASHHAADADAVPVRAAVAAQAARPASAAAFAPAPAAAATAVGTPTRDDERPPAAPRTASILVMPFAASPADLELARGLTHDVIFGLAKLRGLSVIARGTAFAVQARAADPQAAGRLLGVGYHASGSLVRAAGGLRIGVELAATETGRLLWADDVVVRHPDSLDWLVDFTRRIVGALDHEVHLAERNRALLLPPESLDAWQTYHRGLWHMYRFTAADNGAAQALFQRATALDPAFARAHAALSFTHFQNAFLLNERERAGEIGRAYDSAGRALMADAHDPTAHWALGRALWLRGEDEACWRSLDDCVALSPSFAQGHYSRAFVHAQGGDAALALAAADTSFRLSPYDPMLFAIQASRVLCLLRLGQTDAALAHARQAVRQPNIHVHARAIGAVALAAAGALDEGRAELQTILHERPGYALDDYFRAFRMKEELVAICREAAARLGWR